MLGQSGLSLDLAISPKERPMRKFKPGEELQSLVTAIERVTHNDPDVTVESPKRLPDKV